MLDELGDDKLGANVELATEPWCASSAWQPAWGETTAGGDNVSLQSCSSTFGPKNSVPSYAPLLGGERDLWNDAVSFLSWPQPYNVSETTVADSSSTVYQQTAIRDMGEMGPYVTGFEVTWTLINAGEVPVSSITLLSCPLNSVSAAARWDSDSSATAGYSAVTPSSGLIPFASTYLGWSGYAASTSASLVFGIVAVPEATSVLAWGGASGPTINKLIVQANDTTVSPGGVFFYRFYALFSTAGIGALATTASSFHASAGAVSYTLASATSTLRCSQLTAFNLPCTFVGSSVPSPPAVPLLVVLDAQTGMRQVATGTNLVPLNITSPTPFLAFLGWGCRCLARVVDHATTFRTSQTVVAAACHVASGTRRLGLADGRGVSNR